MAGEGISRPAHWFRSRPCIDPRRIGSRLAQFYKTWVKSESLGWTGILGLDGKLWAGRESR